MLLRAVSALFLLSALVDQVQAQLVNVQIGRRFAPVRRPYVTETVVDSWGRPVPPALFLQPSQAQAVPQGFYQAQAVQPRFVIEIRVIHQAAAFPQGQPPPWSSAQAAEPPPSSIPQAQGQPPPWSIPQAQGQPPPWSIPQGQPQLVCGPGG